MTGTRSAWRLLTLVALVTGATLVLVGLGVLVAGLVGALDLGEPVGVRAGPGSGASAPVGLVAGVLVLGGALMVAAALRDRWR
ncbi:hypothetical protein INN71_15385 [Nocardioides sp. ChNu-153]|uniref:hypothetical protein n=1 Tax=Nocardioides sp. ChNu-153 TaxID=2779364 RepID=UPI0026563D80|nr:hypothetical protein [Nocardioides sp. ChNu-153]MDN7122772.1 hypothetical protein [Nocardioides sp. ChNu-153]